MFKIGTPVVYTNEYGVCFGVKVISSIIVKGDSVSYQYFGIEPSHITVDPARLRRASGEDLMAQLCGNQEHFDQYQFPATLAQRAALLDFDPFDGEVGI